MRNGIPPGVREAAAAAIVSDIFLMPGDRHETHQPFTLDPAERQHIRMAHENLWIWGFVAFVDGLGVERRQRFFVQAIVDANLDDTLFRIRPLRPPPLTG